MRIIYHNHMEIKLSKKGRSSRKSDSTDKNILGFMGIVDSDGEMVKFVESHPLPGVRIPLGLV